MVSEGATVLMLLGAVMAFTYAVWVSYRIYSRTREDSDIWFHIFSATLFASLMTYGHFINKLCVVTACGFDTGAFLVPLEVTAIIISSVFTFIGAIRIKQETEHRFFM